MNIKKTLLILITLFFLAGEAAIVWIDLSYCVSLIVILSIVMLELILMLLLTRRKENAQLLQVFAAGLRGTAGSILGVVLFLYVLLHIGWMQDSLREYFTGVNKHLDHFLLHVFFLPLPFFIQSLMVSLKTPLKGVEGRKVLITALSIFDSNRQVTTQELLFFDKKVLNYIKDHEDWKTWGMETDHKERVTVSWKPIFQSVSALPNLDKIIILMTDESEQLLKDIDADSSLKEFGFIPLMQKYFPRHANIIEFRKINAPQSIKTTHFEIRENILMNDGQWRFKDNEICFGITGGTATISAAMAMLSIKGSRGIVYVRQDTREPVAESIDVLTISDLWDEILEKLDLE